MSEANYMGWVQAERYSSLSVPTLRRLAKQGKIRLFRPTPRRTLLSREDIDNYISSTQLTAAS